MIRQVARRFQDRRHFTRTLATNSSSSSAPSVGRKRLDVAIVGAPNAGKSQLLNVLTRLPVAAVSRKRHTTRTDILGARTVDDTQIVFKDTPGFLRIENAKEEGLNRDLIATAASEMQNVDYSLLVVDSARSLTENYRQAMIQLMQGAMNCKGRIEEDDSHENIQGSIEAESENEKRSKFAIVLNKVDLVKPKSKLLELAMDIGAMADDCIVQKYGNGETEEGGVGVDFDTMMKVSPIVFYVSALKEDGTEEILDHLLEQATPCEQWAVEPGQGTNMTTLEHVEELIREKIYRCLHQELPHSIFQVNRLFRKLPQGVLIHQDLVVFSKSHQKLVLGSGGRTLQRIQDSAARDLQKLFRSDVVLRLHVKLNKSKQRRSAEEYA